MRNGSHWVSTIAIGTLIGIASAGAEPTTKPAQAQAALVRPAGKPWLGISITSVSDPESRDVADDLGYLDDFGLLVQMVLPGAPAEGKLQAGDILTEANDTKLVDVVTLQELVAKAGPGAELTLRFVREQKMHTTKVTLGTAPRKTASSRPTR